MTNPSRSLSQGRLARAGSSLRVERARMAANPPTPMGVMAASAPPAIMTSASPCWMMRKESPMEWALVVQAVAVASFGPLAPTRMETCPAARLTMEAGMKNGRDLARAAFEERGVLALDHVESADAGADVDADHLGVFGRDLQLRHFHRFVGGGDGEVNEAAHLLYFFFLDEVERVEVANLGGNLAGKGGGVEGGDAADAAFAGEQRLPYRFGSLAHGADQADAGDDDSARQIELPPFFCERPQGLKPGVYRAVLRGPEGPLFHGDARI